MWVYPYGLTSRVEYKSKFYMMEISHCDCAMDCDLFQMTGSTVVSWCPLRYDPIIVLVRKSVKFDEDAIRPMKFFDTYADYVTASKFGWDDWTEGPTAWDAEREAARRQIQECLQFCVQSRQRRCY